MSIKFSESKKSVGKLLIPLTLTHHCSSVSFLIQFENPKDLSGQSRGDSNDTFIRE